jgi:hypothetical protein
VVDWILLWPGAYYRISGEDEDVFSQLEKKEREKGKSKAPTS